MAMAVDVPHAGAALSGAAAEFRAGELQLLAQHPQEARALRRADADRPAVDGEIDRHIDSFLVRDHATPRAKSRSMLRSHQPRIGCARTLLLAAPPLELP